MRTAIRALHQNPKYQRIFDWGKLITVTGSAQILVQVIGLLSGILIIRYLSTEEYALYTLVNTMLGTMTVLSDGGIGAGVMAQGGKVWTDKDKLGSVINTGFELRKKFAIGSLVVATPILVYLMLHHGAGWLKVLSLIVCLVPTFIAALSDSLLEISLKLRQDISTLQGNQVFVNVLRLIFVCSVVLVPFASIAILAAGVPRILGNIKLRKAVKKHVNWSQKPDSVIQKQILTSVKGILPGAIYYCVSGQINIWLISIFGNTKSIAEMGALSRLTMVLTVISTIFNTLITPRYARLPNDRKVLLEKFIKIMFILITITSSVVGIVWLFPQVFLSILGKGYSNLSMELNLNVIGSCLNLICGLLFALSTNRGWVVNPVILIGTNIATVVLGCMIFNISSLYGILLFNILTSFVPLVLLGSHLLYKILKAEQVVLV